MGKNKTSNLAKVLWGSRPKCEIEHSLALLGWGLLQRLRESKMTIEDAERELFNMDVYQAVRRQRLDPALVDFLAWGMELEDVVALVPKALTESYEEMTKILLMVLRRSSAKTRRLHKAQRVKVHADV
jgi:hypothetical protein